MTTKQMQQVTQAQQVDQHAPLSRQATIYLAGPMTGYHQSNYPKFFDLETKLKSLGFSNILNPANNPKDVNCHSWEEFMRDAIKLIIDADAVIFLDGWERSRGANIELIIAQALKLKVLDENLKELKITNNSTETVCQEADRLVSFDRGNDYGHPIEDFSRTGSLWAPILSEWAKITNGEDPISAELVGLCMIALKISREINRPKRDNRVDIAGYAKCLEMINEKRISMNCDI